MTYWIPISAHPLCALRRVSSGIGISPSPKLASHWLNRERSTGLVARITGSAPVFSPGTTFIPRSPVEGDGVASSGRGILLEFRSSQWLYEPEPLRFKYDAANRGGALRMLGCLQDIMLQNFSNWQWGREEGGAYRSRCSPATVSIIQAATISSLATNRRSLHWNLRTVAPFRRPGAMRTIFYFVWYYLITS